MNNNLNNTIFEKIFKLIIVVVSFTGLVLNFRIAPVKSIFLYFTIISNIMCLILYLVTLILYLSKKLKKERVIFDLIGEKYLSFNNCTNMDYIKLGNLVKGIKLNEFNIEFVKQNNNYIFTDFYSNEL